jgi:hypothetical protein
MKKQYIIPEAEVIEVKTNQLLMASTSSKHMDVLDDDELENSNEILSRKYVFDE